LTGGNSGDMIELGGDIGAPNTPSEDTFLDDDRGDQNRERERGGGDRGDRDRDRGGDRDKDRDRYVRWLCITSGNVWCFFLLFVAIF
jgi:hypothetical protein